VEARHIGFRIGDVLASGDELAEWIATLAIAVHDAEFAGGLVTNEEDQGRWIYAVRLSFSHFYELGKYLEKTDSLPAVQSFLATLPGGTAEYDHVLQTFRKHKTALSRIRNEAGFHYPKWRDNRRLMTRALSDTASKLGLVRMNDPVLPNRLMFADEIVSAIVTTAAGGKASLKTFAIEIAEAINSFAAFSDAAIDRYLASRVDTTKIRASRPPRPPERLAARRRMTETGARGVTPSLGTFSLLARLTSRPRRRWSAGASSRDTRVGRRLRGSSSPPP
jgi:hypothetical protein